MKVFCWEVGDQVGRNGLLLNESPLPASILQKVKKVFVTRILNTSFTANLVHFTIFLSKCECVTRLAGLVWSSINHLCLPRGQVTSPPTATTHRFLCCFSAHPPLQCDILKKYAHYHSLPFLLLFLSFLNSSSFI